MQVSAHHLRSAVLRRQRQPAAGGRWRRRAAAPRQRQSWALAISRRLRGGGLVRAAESGARGLQQRALRLLRARLSAARGVERSTQRRCGPGWPPAALSAALLTDGVKLVHHVALLRARCSSEAPANQSRAAADAHRPRLGCPASADRALHHSAAIHRGGGLRERLWLKALGQRLANRWKLFSTQSGLQDRRVAHRGSCCQ